MDSHNLQCRATTSTVPDFVDLTDEIQRAVTGAGISDGRVTVFAPGPSSAILVNERESGLLEDLKGALTRVPSASGNGTPAIGSSSVVLPVVDGKLRLGTWQRVLLVEMERPGERLVSVQVIGE